MRSLVAIELRPMLLPAMGVLAAVLAAFVLSTLQRPVDTQFGVFMLGCAYLAALPFGLEFHQRTFGLLLSQPVPRYRVWWRKTAVIFAVALMLAALCYWTWPRTRSDERWDVLISMALTASSACFWTLVARSIIGGAVFTIAGQVLIALAVNLVQAIVARIFGPVSDTSALVDDKAMLVAIPLSCAAFLWLSWRQFRRFEVTDAAPLRTGYHARSLFARREVPLLRIVRGAPVMNLVRKELLLYKPALALALLFTMCWLAAIILRWLAPERVSAEFFVVLGLALTIVTALLVGSLSISEERNLGIADWHRSLPLPLDRLWNLKVLVAFLVTLSVGIALPFLLTSLAVTFGEPGSKTITAGELLLGMLFSGTALLAVAIWASALTANPVRSAALATLVAVALILLFVLASYVINETNVGRDLQSTLASWLLPLAAELHLDSRQLQSMVASPVPGGLALGLLCWVTLAQSWRQYRDPQCVRSALRFCIWLLVMTPAIAFSGLRGLPLLGAAVLVLLIWYLVRPVRLPQLPSPLTPFIASVGLAAAGFLTWLVFLAFMNALTSMYSSGALPQ